MDSKLLLIGGAGVLAYLWWKGQQDQAAAVATGRQTTPLTVLPNNPVATSIMQTQPLPQPILTVQQAAKPTPVGFEAKVRASVMAGGVSDTYLSSQQAPDTWNWFAMRAFPNWTAPAPEDMFPNTSDAHKPVDFQTWLAAVTPFSSKVSLSGMRLYGGWGGSQRRVWA